MPARNDQTDEWRLQLRIRQIVCRDMPADMVNRHKRQIQRIGGSLRKIHADQHRADEPRRIGDCDGVQIPARQAALHKRLICQTINCFNVLARCNLRHHAAVELVQLHLRGDAVG